MRKDLSFIPAIPVVIENNDPIWIECGKDIENWIADKFGDSVTWMQYAKDSYVALLDGQGIIYNIVVMPDLSDIKLTEVDPRNNYKPIRKADK